MGGKGDRIKGKANEVAGTVTGDRKQEMKGKSQQAKGKVVDKAKEKDAELRKKSGDKEGG